MTEDSRMDLTKLFTSMGDAIICAIKSETKNYTGIVNLIIAIGIVFSLPILCALRNVQNPISDRLIFLIELVIGSAMFATIVEIIKKSSPKRRKKSSSAK